VLVCISREQEERRAMEKRDEELIRKHLKKDEELKKHYDEHMEFEKQLENLQGQRYLTPEQELEKKTIQKLKLAGKDKIERILSKYRATGT
jgi:uncharacterized protein YdcH (DUF465 family)